MFAIHSTVFCQVVLGGVAMPKSLFTLQVKREQNQFFKVHIILIRNCSFFPVQSVDNPLNPRLQFQQTGPVLIASAGILVSIYKTLFYNTF